MSLSDKKPRSRSRPVKAAAPPVKPEYEVPKWAGKPPQGMHMDVMKEGKLIEKFIIDGKTHFFFGRQHEFIDFTIEHTSCSRVHAVMVFHQHLKRMFLVDLGSTHGTFIGSIRLEPNKPMQFPVDETIRFGASTRTWTLRERPPNAGMLDGSLNSSNVNNESMENDNNISLLGLPEAENDLDDLTEFNTAHNRRLATLPVDESVNQRKRKKSVNNVSFSAEEEIINPEDVDPTIGRFRNLISTEIIIPNKKSKPSQETQAALTSPESRISKAKQDFHTNNLYGDSVEFTPLTAGIKISSAPDVEAPFMALKPVQINSVSNNAHQDMHDINSQEPFKKKYLKEAWPGRKPTKGQNLLSV